MGVTRLRRFGRRRRVWAAIGFIGLVICQTGAGARESLPESREKRVLAVLFGEPSYVEQHPWRVVGGVGLCLSESLLIAGFVIQQVLRRRAEAQSRRTEERYRSVVETQGELICRFLPDTTLTFVNDAFCRFWQRSRGELLGTRFIDLGASPTASTLLERMGRLREGLDTEDRQVTLPDKSIGWQQWVYYAIRGENGVVREVQGVGREITERKRDADLLAAAEARQRAVLRAVPDLMFVLGRDGTYIDYHARDPSLLFVPPSAFLGKTIRDIMPSDLAETFMTALEEAFASKEPVVVEYELALDQVRSFETRLVYVDQDRAVSVVRDVTEVKRALELNRQLAGRLIASQEAERRRIARDLHDDLSQKLALLNIEIDQIADRIDADEERFRLECVSRQTGEIASYVHQLSHGLLPSKLEVVGLVASVQSLCQQATQFTETLIEFTHDGLIPATIDNELSLCVYRIAQEALHNIAKHSQAHHASVRLSREGGELSLLVADSGVGFNLRSVHSSGLGLVSMQERVSLMKGRIAIHTALGQGTRIGVRIPFAPAVPPAEHEQPYGWASLSPRDPDRSETA